MNFGHILQFTIQNSANVEFHIDHYKDIKGPLGLRSQAKDTKIYRIVQTTDSISKYKKNETIRSPQPRIERILEIKIETIIKQQPQKTANDHVRQRDTK